MNWILETYSEVYSTAMMGERKHERHAAPAKATAPAKRPGLFGFLGRR
jgi:hypothetical protein